DRLAQLLVRHRARWIDRLRPLEFGRGALQIAFFPQLHSSLHMLLAGLEPNRIQLYLVGGVVRILLGSLLVEDERGVVILNRLCFFTLVEIGLALRTARCEQSESNTQK